MSLNLILRTAFTSLKLADKAAKFRMRSSTSVSPTVREVIRKQVVARFGFRQPDFKATEPTLVNTGPLLAGKRSKRR